MSVKPLIPAIALALLFAACNAGGGKASSPDALLDEIANLERTTKTPTPDEGKMNELIGKYDAFLASFPEDEHGSEFLYRKGELQRRMNECQKVTATFKTLAEKYPTHKKTPEALYEAAECQAMELKNFDEAGALYDLIIKNYPKSPFAGRAGFWKSNLTKDADQLKQTISQTEEQLFADSTSANMQFDRNKASNVVNAYEIFAARFPSNEATPEYLFKAAEIHRSMRNFDRAIGVYNQICKNYPDYEKTPHSLFLSGFTYENDLKNLDKAKAVYEEFLVKYPDHELADDVQFSLDNLGKSPEDIIKGFEAKKGT